MKQNLTAFITAVKQSKVLTGVQKKELLDAPELLPEGYRAHLTEVLRGYDDRARVREAAVGKRMEEALRRFARELDAADIADEEKQTLLMKSRKHIDAVTQNAPVS